MVPFFTSFTCAHEKGTTILEVFDRSDYLLIKASSGGSSNPLILTSLKYDFASFLGFYSSYVCFSELCTLYFSGLLDIITASFRAVLAFPVRL